MYKMRGKLRFIYVFIDIICLVISFYLYYFWRYNPDFFNIITNPTKWHNLSFFACKEYTAIFMLWGALSLLSLQRSGLFATDRSLSIMHESWKVFKALLLALLPTIAAVFMLKVEVYSRLVFISAWLSAVILLSLWRILKRFYIRYRLKKGLGLVKVIIVGTNSISESIIRELNRHPDLGLEIVGILTDEKLQEQNFHNIKLLGRIEDLEVVIRKYYIDEVFVAVSLPQQQMVDLVLVGRELGCGVKIVPESFEYIYGDFKTYKLGYIHLVEYCYKKLHGTELFIKRFFDIAASYFILLFLTPVFLAIGLAIKIEDGGPIFYISKRVGRKGKIFNFYKFRSMIFNADQLKESLREKNEVTGPIFKIKKDPRITKTGVFLRRYSLDELPQFWNVLKGDMSLVGPRPPTPDEVEKYDAWQMRRLEVKPGITCLWQVRGRSNLSFYKWVKWDLWYIDNWSFGLDLRILFWTIPAVINKEGAY